MTGRGQWVHAGPSRALSWAIRVYRSCSATRPAACRFWPTCSAYALDAIDDHGAARGTVLALRRLARCHPWGGHGVDPVPVAEARHERRTPPGLLT